MVKFGNQYRMNVPPALRGAVMNSEFNTASNTTANTTRNNKKNKNANKTRKNTVRPFVPVRPLVASVPVPVPSGGGGAAPTEDGVRIVGGLKYTPGYGKINFMELINMWNDAYKTMPHSQIQERFFSKLENEFKEKFKERDIIAIQLFDFGSHSRSSYGSYSSTDIRQRVFLIDNHGQRHFTGASPLYLFEHENKKGINGAYVIDQGQYVIDNWKLKLNSVLNDELFPTPLPDVLIDQIKLTTYLTSPELVSYNYPRSANDGELQPLFSWNPVAHIENLKKA